MSRLASVALATAIACPLLVIGCAPHRATPTVSLPSEAGHPSPVLPSAVVAVPLPTRRASRTRSARLTTDAPMDADGYTAADWASSRAARAVAECESGNDPTARSSSGRYRGKWQMDADFWRTYGGLHFASTPDRASTAEQDEIAFRGWLDRGWQPWTCARIVGVG